MVAKLAHTLSSIIELVININVSLVFLTLSLVSNVFIVFFFFF